RNRLLLPRAAGAPELDDATCDGAAFDRREAGAELDAPRPGPLPRHLPFRHLQSRLPGEASAPAEDGAFGVYGAFDHRIADAALVALRFHPEVRPQAFPIPWFTPFTS